MAKKVTNIQVKDTLIRTMRQNGIDYVCITDIARQKNAAEPKDVVKNWMRLKNTIEYIGLWEKLNNPQFKGVGFDPLLQEAGSNAFTLSPTKWIEQTNAIGIVCTTGRNGGTYAQRDIAFKFAKFHNRHPECEADELFPPTVEDLGNAFSKYGIVQIGSIVVKTEWEGEIHINF